MPRLLHNHHRLLARPNRRHLWWMLNRTMSANGRQGSIDRGVQLQEEVEHTAASGNNDGGRKHGGKIDVACLLHDTRAMEKI